MCDPEDLAGQVAAAAQQRKQTVAVAESLTGGMLTCQLSAARQASDWFRGGIVAYSSVVKHRLLRVPAGPVVSEPAVLAMVRSTADIMSADIAVALTGVGGPDDQDGQPPGTVWFGVADERGARARLLTIPGATPAAVCETASTRALRMLLAALLKE